VKLVGLWNPAGLHRTWAVVSFRPLWSTGQSWRLFRLAHVPRIGMVTQAYSPHYLLYSEASGSTGRTGRWRFVLQTVTGEDQFSASDSEPQTRSSRLELLAVVRGLEALDQPSRVTLVTRSRYVARGIRRELNHWRERRWRWERFGQLVPIRDHDLWQRIDRALQFHEVNCARWGFDSAPYAPSIRPIGSGAEAAGVETPLLTVRSRSARPGRRIRRWPIIRALNSLRDGVLAPFSAVLRPAFTRAA
jgi:ribonuclease HI